MKSSGIHNWFDKLSNLGDVESFDKFDRTSNQLINQIQITICAWLIFFLIKDCIDANPDYRMTLLLLLLMMSFFFIRNKINYLAAAATQICICIFAVSVEFYIHDLELRIEPLYVVVLLLAALLLPNNNLKIFFVVLTIFSYALVTYLAKNFELIIQSDVSKEDNFLIFVFGAIMVMIITLRYFQLIKNILKEQTRLLNVLQSKNKELERFAYITSHDLKQPLRNIGSFAGLLRRTMGQQNKEEKKLEYLGEIESSAGRMNRLIEEILSFSRMAKIEINKEEIELETLVEEFRRSHSEYLKERNAKIITLELPTVKGNRIYLSLLFQNLIENGIKYNKSKFPTITISSRDSKLHHTLCIEDNGIGIAKEFYSSIFEPFQRLHSRRNYEGTGLGLSICKKIIENHQGNIWVENVGENTGTKFIFELPK